MTTDKATDSALDKAIARETQVQMPRSSTGWPQWVQVPAELTPPKGRRIIPVLFRAAWTNAPESGDHQCILWSLNDLDDKVALGRAMGEPLRLADEYAKRMVRAFDGVAVRDDGSTDGEFLRWWGMVGKKCTDMIWKLYLQEHRLSDKERQDFFDNCLAVVILG